MVHVEDLKHSAQSTPFYENIFFCYRKHDDEIIGNNNFQRARTGASLRASTRGEIGSNMLQRSVRSRRSLKSIGEPSVMA